jgi:Uma2 family endonuclease
MSIAATRTTVRRSVPSANKAGKRKVPESRLPRDWTAADLQKHLGGIPLERILLSPPPGCATEADVTRLAEHEDRLCELEDGILVEKTVGWHESLIALWIGSRLNAFLETHDLGIVLGADGTLKILPGIVKIPDVSFICWARFPKKDLRDEPIPALIPDLAVEVLSKSNTKPEMDAKLVKYFKAGVRLVWYIHPTKRTAQVYTSPTDVIELDEAGVLDGGDVLPGFRLPLKELFERADNRGPSERKRMKQPAKSQRRSGKKTPRRNGKTNGRR